MANSTLYSLIAVAGIICGILFGYIGYQKGLKKESYKEGNKDGELKADMEYVKRGVDDIRIEQRIQGQKTDALAERVTRVEESSKQAHKRLDDIARDKG